MSLYNMLMGRNPASPYLLAILGITQKTTEQYPLGRIRDTWINSEATSIFVLHRNYGDEGAPFIEAISKHPLFVANHVAPNDNTYGWYEFRVPDESESAALLAKQIAETTDNENCMVRYERLIADMQAGKDNAGTRHAMEVGKQILGSLMNDDAPNRQIIQAGDGQVIVRRVDANDDHPSQQGDESQCEEA